MPALVASPSFLLQALVAAQRRLAHFRAAAGDDPDGPSDALPLAAMGAAAAAAAATGRRLTAAQARLRAAEKELAAAAGVQGRVEERVGRLEVRQATLAKEVSDVRRPPPFARHRLRLCLRCTHTRTHTNIPVSHGARAKRR